jgi:polyhydroxyalkanoate synthesis regulator phasin
MNTTVIAAAGGAIAMSLLDTLVSKGILTQQEAKEIVGRAVTQLATARGAEVLDIGQLLSDVAQKFSRS